MTHHRLFVALAIPQATRSALIATMGGIAGARWQTDAQLHCTVRFLGEVDRHMAEDIAAALGSLTHPAIDATIDGMGTFTRDGRINTLWIGLSPVPTFRTLHAKVDRLLARAGVAPDTRAYHPHVTIARFGRKRPPAGFAATMTPPPPATCRLDEVRLYESQLGREGAHYETIARYRLG